MDTNEEACF